MKKKTLVVMMVMLIFFMGCASSVPEEPGPKLPIELPFAVYQAGAMVSTELRIVENKYNPQNNYPFDLIFTFREGDEADRARVRKLVGGWDREKINGEIAEPGIPILLQISISVIEASGERPFFEKEILTKAMWAYGSDRFYREIDTIHIPPGFYNVKVQSLKGIPELAATKIMLFIHLRRGGK